MPVSQRVDKSKAAPTKSPKPREVDPNRERFNPLWQSLALRPAAIQPKLAVSQPGDPYEQEADSIADRVMRMAGPSSSDTDLSFSPLAARKAQRKCAPCGEEEEKVQRKGEGSNANSPATAPPIVHEVLNSPAQQLDPSTRSFMESRFNNDFSGVRVHTDGRAAQSAAAINARAFTLNRDIVFGAGEYSPHTQSGRRLLSHELTHVVQQGQGDVTGDGIGVARNTSRSVAGSIQRFESDEHREIGDDATRGAHGEVKTVQLADDYRITYGEMVAMAGDYFESIDQMRAIARNPGKGAGTREEVEYVRVVEVHGLKAREEEFSKEARHAVDLRYYALAARNPSHFVNPESGDMGKSTGEKASAHHTESEIDWKLFRLKFKEMPNNAVGYYRMNHVRAIVEAWNAGKAGESIDQAMAVEAFSNHYLTDSFSAGHNRTARTSATDYWNQKQPMFFYNFKGFMAEKLAYWINEHNWRGVATVDYIWGKATKALNDTLAKKGMPDFSFGDLVSGAIHDYDNAKGIQVTVDGKAKEIFGDASLHKGDTKDVAVKAVQASVVDIETAYEAGKAKTNVLSLAFRLLPRGLFRAEEMIPVATPDAALPEPARAIKWDYPSAFELLSDGKFREGVKILLASKKAELAKVGEGLEEDYQRDAFKASILDQMVGDEGITMIWRILEWTPNTGGGVGGHNQDDNALDYYNQAKNTSGGLASLMWSSRANLIKNLVDGATFGDEENAILDLLVTCPSDADVRLVINFITWDRLEDEVGKRFKDRYPEAQYKSK